MAKVLERGRGGNAFYLYPIRAWMLKSRIGQPVLEQTIVSEKQQTFTVPVQPAHRINSRYTDVLLEGA